MDLDESSRSSRSRGSIGFSSDKESLEIEQYRELRPQASPTSQLAVAEGFRFERVIIDPVESDWAPEEVVVGDVTGDRRPDVVMTMSYYGSWPEPDVYSRLRIYAQEPDGSLATPIEIKRSWIGGLELVDLDQRGVPEIVFGEQAGLTVVAKYGTSFVPTWYAGLERVGANNGSVAAIDANGDGHADLFVQSTEYGAEFFLGDGFGGISGVKRLETSYMLFPHAVEASDFTADGLPDIVVQTGNIVRIYPSRWMSSMGQLVELDLSAVQSGQFWGMTVADIDRNGRPDLVVSDQGDNSISLPKGIRVLYRGAGNTFSRSVFLETPGYYNYPGTVRVADIDGNGYPDIVVMFDSYDMMGYFLQGPSGFAPVVYQNTDDNLWTNNFYRDGSYAVADVNSDGCLDIVLAELSSSLRIFYGRNCQKKPAPGIARPLPPVRRAG
ncbi:VCBS repeat-containing protein [Lysobacter sp. M15]|uniref:FG-GAP repeat domain-containing protein n=1 Tax=Lysobacter sp. M15 TaxID=2916837 RepID=UPI001F5A640E|nr:VCBS repeat-containing protein [Lysobacter sp. M15]